MSIDYNLIGKRIMKYRSDSEVTQEKLAEITGLSAPYISQIENGHKKASLNTLVAISNALEITVNELLTGNQLFNSADYQKDINLLLDDCTPTEKRFIIQLLISAKKMLRDNNWTLISSTDPTKVREE